MTEIDKGMKKHKRLVLFLFNKYYATTWHAKRSSFPRGIDLEDVLQSCYLGLWEALETYNEHKGNFSTWVKFKIMGHVHQLRTNKKRIKEILFSEYELEDNSNDNEKDNFRLEKILVEEKYPNQTDCLVELLKLEFIQEWVENITDMRIRHICKGRLEGKTFGELSSNLGITKQRVQNIYAKFLKTAAVELREVPIL